MCIFLWYSKSFSATKVHESVLHILDVMWEVGPHSRGKLQLKNVFPPCVRVA